MLTGKCERVGIFRFKQPKPLGIVLRAITPSLKDASDRMSYFKKTLIDSADDDFFLPELCLPEALLSLIVLAELLVLVLVLAEPLPQGFDWMRLALVSLFVQWIVLLSAALLCWLRPYLKSWNALWVGAFSCALVVSLTVLCTVLAQVFFVTETARESLTQLALRHAVVSFVMSALLLRYFYLQSQWQRQRQAQLRARLEALQARMRPHFLFNSLNSIVSLIASAPDKAEQALLDLSDLFRASLGKAGTLVSWQSELELAQRYLAIEHYRLEERLQIEWAVSEVPAHMPIPQLTLQPLLENAVLHGISQRIEGGCIKVQASYDKGLFELCVSNPVGSQTTVISQGTQQALSNINARLTALFGPGASLSVEQCGGYYFARLRYSCTRLMQETRVL